MMQELKSLIESSERIMITSHISPDPDAVSSLLLMNEALRFNYPSKEIMAVLEEEPSRLDFLQGYGSIEFKPIKEALNDFSPEMFILLDGNNYERCSRHDGQSVRAYIRDNGVKTVVIDHHEPDGKDQTDIYINRNSPACAQDVYEVCFDQLNLQKPEGTATTAMVGLYADSGGFAYMKDGSHKQLFTLAERLVSEGADVEKIKNQLSQYSTDNIVALGELLQNVKTEDDFTFSYLSDEFIHNWLARNLGYPELQRSTGVFLDEFVRNIDERLWGFIVYKNRLQGENIYSVSFRSVAGVKDVAAIASTLGGGGHKPAAGAKFQASSIQDAIEKVKAAINQTGV